jgi:hypothetical protein
MFSQFVWGNSGVTRIDLEFIQAFLPNAFHLATPNISPHHTLNNLCIAVCTFQQPAYLWTVFGAKILMDYVALSMV